jgi:hypothetical protein
VDLMNLLRSVEALLYEIVSWLVFYPLTLWRIVTRPQRMMAYAERELTDRPDEQFVDALSPPIFLFLTLLIAHMIELRFGQPLNLPAGILSDDRSLLIFRAVAFSIFPLLAGIQRVRQKSQQLNRTTLRPAFYSQCYLAAPFVLAIDVSFIVRSQGGEGAVLAGLALLGAGLSWYVLSLAYWFRQQAQLGWAGAMFRAVATLFAGFALLFVLLIIVALETGAL